MTFKAIFRHSSSPTETEKYVSSPRYVNFTLAVMGAASETGVSVLTAAVPFVWPMSLPSVCVVMLLGLSNR